MPEVCKGGCQRREGEVCPGSAELVEREVQPSQPDKPSQQGGGLHRLQSVVRQLERVEAAERLEGAGEGGQQVGRQVEGGEGGGERGESRPAHCGELAPGQTECSGGGGEGGARQ